MRSEAIHRLNELSAAKRFLQELDTPSPPNRKKSFDSGNSVFNPNKHAKEQNFQKTSSSCQRQIATTFEVESSNSSDIDHSYQILPSINFGKPEEKEIRERLENQILLELNNQMQSLCTNDEFGSILHIPSTDTRLSKVAELAETECRTKVPFLFKVLQTASDCSGRVGENSSFFIFVIYGVLMRCRSQRFNVLQRLITSACIRYRAGNEVY